MKDILGHYKGITPNGIVECDTIFQTGVKPDIEEIILNL